MSNILETIFETAEIVLTDVVTGAEAIAPIASQIPGAGGVVSGVESTAKAVLAAIEEGRSLVATATPEIGALITSLESLFHVTQTPQAIVLTPKTTSATKAS